MKLITGLILLKAVYGASFDMLTPEAGYQWRHGEPIQGQYIVKLKIENNTASIGHITSSIRVTPLLEFSVIFNGFVARLSDSDVKKLKNHPHDFEGRASYVASYLDDATDEIHGTYVAGIIASTKYGVAKKSKLLSIRVLDDAGRTSASLLTKSLEDILRERRRWLRKCPMGMVVNISLGVPKSQIVNTAARTLVENGYFVVASAGNDAREVDISPASELRVCTVGSTTRLDQIALDSNFGIDLDIYAPGVHITSTKSGGGYLIASGTTVAAPHVAGVGACLLAQGQPAHGLCDLLGSMALRNAINLRGRNGLTPNLLLNNGFKKR
ncbi:hypothetical protein QQS21_007286 [Conoideocrella luteorostrata]|uniref:Peptidase S8/S53 domain-containing protein n=1 Tax=Conoideocrella luteorostrata TaxID=1105319 RepID=A0AAJ0CNQ3_9HYPO|nr:hypothetical protein QQS21_007286 [Conoideocrella luteorostrata]